MVPISHWIVPTPHIMVLISHLMVPIEWVPYPQKECGYCRMTHDYQEKKKFPSIHFSHISLSFPHGLQSKHRIRSLIIE